MDFDYRKLLGKMREMNISQASLAKQIGLSESQFNRKLKGVYCFTQDEIFKMCEALDIRPNEIDLYFFTLKVEKT